MAIVLIPLALLVGAAVFAALAIVITVLLLKFAKNFLANSAIGVLALLAINFLGVGSGFHLAVSIPNMVVAGLFGLAGVGILVVLKVLGITL
ncbi:MAG: pro-sigmaK processing inhibitor BofA family protein [Candidatus Micrarchaeia archaeon]|jgi:inhibitor of the pro-sigma K processing machinery